MFLVFKLQHPSTKLNLLHKSKMLKLLYIIDKKKYKKITKFNTSGGGDRPNTTYNPNEMHKTTYPVCKNLTRARLYH